MLVLCTLAALSRALFQDGIRLFDALVRAVARALSPPACAACDAPTSGGSVLCPLCAPTLIRPDPVLRPRAPGAIPLPVIAAAAFGGAMAAAIRRFKYDDRPDLSRPLGKLLRAAAREAGVRAEIIVPVPLHPRRLAERGYNQAALLATQLAAELSTKTAARCLSRRRHTEKQARLGRGDRLANVADVFQVREPRRVRGRAVLLVDDVVTTGATLAACRNALLKAGAESVTCIVLAQAG